MDFSLSFSEDLDGPWWLNKLLPCLQKSNDHNFTSNVDFNCKAYLRFGVRYLN